MSGIPRFAQRDIEASRKYNRRFAALEVRERAVEAESKRALKLYEECNTWWKENQAMMNSLREQNGKLVLQLAQYVFADSHTDSHSDTERQISFKD